MKKAIFTVLLNGYDNEPRPHRFPNWDNVIITNQPLKYAKQWTKVIEVPPTDNPQLQSRIYKWQSHLFLPEYDLVCYHDANIVLQLPPPDKTMRLKHPRRSTVTEEVKALALTEKRVSKDKVEAQLKAFLKDGFPDDIGLFMNGFFVRHHTEKENKIGDEVIRVLEKLTHRDQLALPYVFWKFGYKPENVKTLTKYYRPIRVDNHQNLNPKIEGTPQKIRVHHITPATADKNYGLIINRIIEAIPDTDWICLRDIDTIPPDHVTFIQQVDEIANNGKFDLVGCMTNRLGLTWQLANGVYSENFDFLHHVQVAKELSEKYGTKVTGTIKNIAGLFLLFPKRTWVKVGGFKEGGIRLKGHLLDYHFWKDCKDKGLKIGIAEGVYLFHNYRSWADSRKDTRHLDL